MANLWVGFNTLYSGECPLLFFFFFMKSESFFVLEMHMVLILNLSLSHWSKVLGKIAIFSLVVSLGIPSIL